MDTVLHQQAIALLKKLIATPSFSKEEDKTGDFIELFFQSQNIQTYRKLNNIWAFNLHYDPKKPTVLLNSHHDTVKPNAGYTKNPFEPVLEGDYLYGLGSNDAGGPLVSLIATFLYFYPMKDLKYNFIISATAEEEISGKNGVELIIPDLGELSFAIVGEPTKMELAVSERGLMVVDCIAHGKSGHAARKEGENSIYKAISDIEWLRTFEYPKVSPTLGKIQSTTTIIHSGTQHNVVPDRCEFTVDVRLTDAYKPEEVLEIMQKNMQSELNPRSTRLRPSFISEEHPIVKAGVSLGRPTYGSPTTSDQALIPVPSIKLGPGDSARSHTADEYIRLSEIENGIDLYIKMLSMVVI